MNSSTCHRRRIMLVKVGLGCPFLIVVLSVPLPGVTGENYFRIQYGMTEPQLEAILGKSGEVLIRFPVEPCLENPPLRCWHGDCCQIVVEFDEHGKVLYKHYCRNEFPDNSTFWNKLRSFLGIVPREVRRGCDAGNCLEFRAFA